jgi:GTP-binding protein Era
MRSQSSLSPVPGDSPTRAGFVAIIGLPNAGKSSLLNRLLGQKLSIVTSAAQTTRERVVGIDTRDGVQMVFMDTPGIVDPAYLLHQAMLGIVWNTIEDADVVVLLLDGTEPPPAFVPELTSALGAARSRLIVAINKVDTAGQVRISELQVWIQEQFGVEAVLVSAATGRGLERLRVGISDRLPESPFLYPEEDVSTQTMRFFTSELLREAVFELYQEEIPYSVAARVDEFREEETPLYIRATVFVERASQKGILIGKGGEAIRQLGTKARSKIEELVGRRVYLDLWVKVLPRWRKDPLELQRLGFPVPIKED